MKKSFRWHLFIRLFIATAVIIYANRIFAQYLNTRYMHDRIAQTIAGTLDQCQDQTSSSRLFLLCAAHKTRGQALSSVSEYYVLCEPRGQPGSPEDASLCAQSRSIGASQPREIEEISDAARMTRQTIQGDEWLVFSLKRAPEGTQVMIRSDDITQYVKSIWDLRDRILIYVLPVILLMLTMLTLYMTWAMLRPIRQLEASLTGLSSRNLDKPLGLLPPYREFSKFVTVFEQLRVRLNESFLQARRFTADASHELRTPLTILRGNSERLIAELPTGSDAQVRMRLISDEVERLIDITEKLLLLARADSSNIHHEMKQEPLSELINELIQDMMAFQPDLKIFSDIAPDISWACDRSLVQQLLHNLYTNAAKYNTADGWIRLSLTRQQDVFTLSMENPCANIAPDLSERAFQRFYRGDAARGRQIDGIGLGLNLCLEIARLHQARLHLQVTERKTVVATLEGSLSVPEALNHQATPALPAT